MITKKLTFLLLNLFISIVTYGQTIQISGQVLDAQSKSPLAFVTIGIEGTNTGFITDIDGRFNSSISEQSQSLTFSFIGYERKVIEVKELKANPIILLNQRAVEVSEVRVVPGINPADIIMNQVIENRKLNNPEEATQFSYDSYNKLVFTVNPDSISKKMEMQKDSVNKDSSLLYTADYISKQHLVMMESVSHRDFMSPTKDKEVILASRVSGLKSPEFSLIGTQLQSFSFYKDYVELMDY